ATFFSSEQAIDPQAAHATMKNTVRRETFMTNSFRRARLSLSEAVTPEQPIEVHPIDARVPRSGSDVVAVSREHLLDVLSFEGARPALARGFERLGHVGHRCGIFRKIALERCALAQSDAPFDVVPELANVAGPCMAREIGDEARRAQLARFR